MIFIKGTKLLSDSHRWHSDGKYFAAPKLFKQVYIIHAYTANGHTLLCAYLRQKKKIVTALKNTSGQMCFVFNPKTIVTDFDCHGAELKGCYFHFDQAILRWAFRCGYKSQYSINPTFNTWFKMILSLQVVPMSRLMEAWSIIINKLSANINVQPMIDYFNALWIKE